MLSVKALVSFPFLYSTIIGLDVDSPVEVATSVLLLFVFR
jgi:hypothetical protein